MVMPDTVRSWTREMVLALPDDGNRYELLDGAVLVTPAPTWRHQAAAAAVFRRIDPYVRATRVGVAGFAPADLALEGEQIAQPDVFVVPLRPDGQPPRVWEEIRIPLLVVEILSPSTAHKDRMVKRRRYQRTGVAEYWVVDLDSRLVERWRPGDERPEILDRELSWQPDPAHPALIVDLAELFQEVPPLQAPRT
jgi:Uma2 family endonuclease